MKMYKLLELVIKTDKPIPKNVDGYSVFYIRILQRVSNIKLLMSLDYSIIDFILFYLGHDYG